LTTDETARERPRYPGRYSWLDLQIMVAPAPSSVTPLLRVLRRSGLTPPFCAGKGRPLTMDLRHAIERMQRLLLHDRNMTGTTRSTVGDAFVASEERTAERGPGPMPSPREAAVRGRKSVRRRDRLCLDRQGSVSVMLGGGWRSIDPRQRRYAARRTCWAATTGRVS
jgi:hypothetical protein